MIFTKISNGYKTGKMIIINEKNLIKALERSIKIKVSANKLEKNGL